MHKITKTKIRTVILVGLFAIVNNVFATDCFEKSPNWVNLNDKYFDVENVITLSNKEKDLLSDFYKNLEGKWKGYYEIIECTGPDNNPIRTMKEATLIAEISTNPDGFLLVKSDMDFRKERITKLGTLNLSGDPLVFDFKISGKSTLDFVEKFRRKNRKGSSLFENIYELKYSGSALKIGISVYLNGVFVSEETWSLYGT